MPASNVEFKAELRDPETARGVCRRMGARLAVTVEQTDTYYRIPNGRLKKRESIVLDTEPLTPDPGDPDALYLDRTPEPVEYIRYQRADRIRPKRSDFSIYAEEEFRERFGTIEPEIRGVVRKVREVWLTRHARIHLDRVDDLGLFIEFECLVTPSHHLGRAHQLMSALRRAFGPVMGEPIAVGYADLLLGNQSPAAGEMRRTGDDQSMGGSS